MPLYKLFTPLNFICAGTTLLASKSFSGSVNDAKAIYEISLNSSHIMATGSVARMLNERKEAELKKYGQSEELPASLLKYFFDHYQGNRENLLQNQRVSAPSLLVEESISAPLTELHSRLSTIDATPLACSDEFKKIMAPFRPEHLTPQNMSYKFKKNKIHIQW